MVARRRALWAPIFPSKSPLTALRSAGYFAQHASIAVPALVVHALAASRRDSVEDVPLDAVDAIRVRYRQILEDDVTQAANGAYPWSLLFDWPIRQYVRAMPGVLRDFLTMDERREGREWTLDEDEAESFPKYYRRQYHWQKGGYLTARSARLYDLGVELLFVGGADVMRRQVIVPMTAAFADHVSPRILDVACGTGHTLGQLGTALPKAELHGVDLSPAYVRHAAKNAPSSATLLVNDARCLPYPDNHFDVVTSTYLFHELPPGDRTVVIEEMVRVAKPGGLIVIQDSAQLDDAPELAEFLHAFGRDMHEPYYANYLNDPLQERLEAAGLDVQSVRSQYLAKTVTARVPMRETA